MPNSVASKLNKTIVNFFWDSSSRNAIHWLTAARSCSSEKIFVGVKNISKPLSQADDTLTKNFRCVFDEVSVEFWEDFLDFCRTAAHLRGSDVDTCCGSAGVVRQDRLVQWFINDVPLGLYLIKCVLYSIYREPAGIFDSGLVCGATVRFIFEQASYQWGYGLVSLWRKYRRLDG
ncbi:hypothetical protein F3Y22_tig00110356pilonHSYRG00015 [Hibiscus syriacus]|uniref:Uncharacterized protein n=1 Tax=Hibiscus syriacus TaxID=106335 RepID=A0A6A3AX92_HIBSY|nr:hypothetical protein F3Y22_tig00110356pilonHSYRG00015 [Hibiscus syriacus]